MSDSTAFVLVPAGPHAGAWARRREHFKLLDYITRVADGLYTFRDVEQDLVILNGCGIDVRLPIKVSPSPEHWAKLLALVIVDQARVVIL